MTAVAGAVFTAADFNTHVRDNLNETAVAKATTAGRIFVATGENSLAERVIASNSINTSTGDITNTGYDDATNDPGPTVTVTTGTSALVFWSARAFNEAAMTYISVAVSGATSIAADDRWGIGAPAPAINTHILRCGTHYMFTSLTAGSNTFTMQFRTTSGTSTVVNRQLFVIPL